MWLLWLAYDTEIQHHATIQSIDPAIHHINVWNDLEMKYIEKRVEELLHQTFNLCPSLSQSYPPMPCHHYFPKNDHNYNDQFQNNGETSILHLNS